MRLTLNRTQIERDFVSEEYLEFLRLLHEASEIEHSLLVQYLYAGLSVQKQYLALAFEKDPFTGYPSNAHTLIGVAIQEMQHLREVNRVLTLFGAAPNLFSQDFPYEPDIYPFPLSLEPLTRASAAKYTYVEAPAAQVDPASPDPAIAKFAKELADTISSQTHLPFKPNHLGSLYGRIIDCLGHLRGKPPPIPGFPTEPEIDLVHAKLDYIRDEGERDHFEFFKSVYLGTHPVFGGKPDVWRKGPDYPSIALNGGLPNRSAYRGHHNALTDPEARDLAWLGNLQYWIALTLLDFHYRTPGSTLNDRALAHMFQILGVGQHAALTRSVGLTFDRLSMGYAAGSDPIVGLGIIASLLRESQAWARRIARLLPDTFDVTVDAATLSAVEATRQRLSVPGGAR